MVPRKLLALSAADRRLLLEAGWQLVRTRVALWVGPAFTEARLLDPRRSTAREPTQSVDRLAWAVGAVARRLPAPFRTCLPQALAVCVMARRRGIQARLMIGVRREPGTSAVEAHAWAECAGRVIVGWRDDLASYVPLDAPPATTLAGAARGA
jgi:hypothetical protein